MFTSIYPPLRVLITALSCLQILFDPAQTGSPYETTSVKTNKRSKHQSPYISKRLSIRM